MHYGCYVIMFYADLSYSVFYYFNMKKTICKMDVCKGDVPYIRPLEQSINHIILHAGYVSPYIFVPVDIPFCGE